MTCDEIRGLIEEYHDRELEPARAEAVRSHVAGCAACAQGLRSLELLDTALRAAPAPADDVRWDRYVERVRDRTRAWRPLPWKAVIPFAAAALLVFGFVRMFSVEARPLIDRYAVAGPDERVRLERSVNELGLDDLAAIVAVMIGDSDPGRRRLAAQLLSPRLNDKADVTLRRLVIDRSSEMARRDDQEAVLVDIGFEPGDEALVDPALEMARSEALFADAARILRRLDRGTLNRTAHSVIVRRLRELLASDMPRNRELAVRLAGELEILLEDVVEFIDVPDLGARVLEFLRRRTGKDFGTDKKAWREWLARRSGGT